MNNAYNRIRNLRLVILIIIVFSAFKLFSQNPLVAGKVIDIKTGMPLHNVHVICSMKSIGAVTDSEGKFVMLLNETNLMDTIRVTHLGYIDAFLSISDYLKIIEKDDTNNFLIQMEPNYSILDEINIVAKKVRNINAKKLFKQVQRNYYNNKPNFTHITKAYFYEFGMLNNNYVFYNDGLGFSIYFGKKKKVAEYSNYKFYCENTRMSDKHSDWINEVKKGNTFLKKNTIGCSDNLNQFRRFEYKGPLSKGNLDRFKYTIDSVYNLNNFNVYKISFTGKSIKGSIDFFDHNCQILNINYTTADLWSSPIGDPVVGNVDIKLSYYNETPFISEIKTNYKYRDFTHENFFKVLSQKYISFNITEKGFWAFNTYAINPLLSYNSKEWINLDYIPDLYQIINKQLVIEGIELEKQFVENSGQWLNKENIESKEVLRIIEMMKKEF